MKDFILFRRMISTIIIQIIFWLMVIGCIVACFILLSKKEENFNYIGILILFLGPILSRIICEFLIIPFRYNETLTDIKNISLKVISLIEKENNILNNKKQPDEQNITLKDENNIISNESVDNSIT